MKIRYEIFFLYIYFERIGRMHKNKIFFVFFHIYIYIATFQRKSGILIPDLYFYSIKIQTNINQNR
jgi:hypothetical protein